MAITARNIEDPREFASMHSLEIIERMIMNSTLSEKRRDLMFERLKRIELEEEAELMIEELRPNQEWDFTKQTEIRRFIKLVSRNE